MADSGTSRVKLSLATPSKAPLSIYAGIVPLHTIEPIPKQFSNAPLRMVSNDSGNTRPSNILQFANALSPILSTSSGISRTPINRQLLAKALLAIWVRVDGNVNFPEKSLLQKAFSEMTFSLFGKCNSPLKWQLAKASFAIFVIPLCKVSVPLKPQL